MSQTSIEAGFVVRLKSGGPLMTVSDEATEEGYVKCYWFKSESVLQQHLFHIETLQMEEDQEFLSQSNDEDDVPF